MVPPAVGRNHFVYFFVTWEFRTNITYVCLLPLFYCWIWTWAPFLNVACPNVFKIFVFCYCKRVRRQWRSPRREFSPLINCLLLWKLVINFVIFACDAGNELLRIWSVAYFFTVCTQVLFFNFFSTYKFFSTLIRNLFKVLRNINSFQYGHKPVF